jgi:histone arginine demethylase JMJD6
MSFDALDAMPSREAALQRLPRDVADEPVPTLSVDRRSKLSRQDFLHEYVIPNRSVIITDATDHWPAMRKFTWDFFRSRYGHVSREVRGVKYRLGDVIDLILDPAAAGQAPYPFNLDIESTFPELLADLSPEIPYGKVDRVNHLLLPRFFMRNTVPYELFFGGRGGFFPRVHYDALWLHNQMTQIIGSKEYFFYPFEQGKYMYPRADNEKTSQVDFGQPDFEKFPLFAKAKPTVFTLQQGETIFFPGGIWHATRIHEPCLTFGRVQLNGINWPNYVADVHAFWRRYHPLFAPFVKGYLGAAGGVMSLQERLL